MTINQRQKFLKYHVHLVDHRTHLLSFEVGQIVTYFSTGDIYIGCIYIVWDRYMVWLSLVYSIVILYIGCAYNARKIQQILLFLNYHIVV